MLIQSFVYLQVRTAREDGSLRIRNLEEALQRISTARGSGGAAVLPVPPAGGTSGDAAATQSMELVRTLAESDAARRAEARLRSELEYERGRVAAADRRYDEAVQAVRDKDVELGEAWVYWTLLLGAGRPAFGSGGGGDAAPGTEQVSGTQPARRYAAAAAAGIRAAPIVLPYGGATSDPGRPPLLDPSLERRLRSQMEELARKQQVIAKLVEQAERCGVGLVRGVAGREAVAACRHRVVAHGRVGGWQAESGKGPVGRGGCRT